MWPNKMFLLWTLNIIHSCLHLCWRKSTLTHFSDCLSLKSHFYGAVPDFLTLCKNVWSTSGSEPGEENVPNCAFYRCSLFIPAASTQTHLRLQIVNKLVCILWQSTKKMYRVFKFCYLKRTRLTLGITSYCSYYSVSLNRYKLLETFLFEWCFGFRSGLTFWEKADLCRAKIWRESQLCRTFLWTSVPVFPDLFVFNLLYK